MITKFIQNLTVLNLLWVFGIAILVALLANVYQDLDT
jgi:hypothetical protein